MPPLFDTPGIHHIGLRCGDLARARHFYGTVLGFPILRAEPILIFQAGAAIIAMKGPEAASPPGDVFNPFRVGLDHIALACRAEDELHRAAASLTAAGVEHTGVKSDPTLAGRKYIAFKDPDRIAWEFYMATP
jgi:catechol 2,3-dioxygenase-like lactoylglutathione lyase family enzyme